MSNSRFDAEGFFAALDAERDARRKNWKQVASEAKVSASTLTRMGQGKRPDVDSMAKLASWSGLEVDRFVRGQQSKRSPEPLAEIAALLRADRNLTTQGVDALESILKSAYAHLRQSRK